MNHRSVKLVLKDIFAGDALKVGSLLKTRHSVPPTFTLKHTSEYTLITRKIIEVVFNAVAFEVESTLVAQRFRVLPKILIN